MKLVCMLNWYEEDPADLKRCVKDVASLGATHVVAVDGAYALFPKGKPRSWSDESEAIRDATWRSYLGCLIYQPQTVWKGNEVEKRQALLDLSLSITGSRDWLLWWDADWKLDSPPTSLIPPTTMHRWGDALLTDAPYEVDAGWYRIRVLYPAVRGAKFAGNHYTIDFPEEGTMILHPRGDDQERGKLLPVKIRHRVEDRTQERRAKQVEYYSARHKLGIETP